MYGGGKFDGTCYFWANQVGLDVSFCWYVLPITSGARRVKREEG